MMMLQIERLGWAARLDKILVATSDESSDDPVAAACSAAGVECFRGSLCDVLGRFALAAKRYPAEHVVRLTADCPLADWNVIDDLIDKHVSGGFDFTSNALRKSFPHGLDAEVVRSSVLQEMAANASDPFEREHVMPFIYRNAERYRIGHLTQDVDLSFLRWTVDTSEDFSLVNDVYEALYRATPKFSTRNVVELLKRNPSLRDRNAAKLTDEDRRRASEYWKQCDREAVA